MHQNAGFCIQNFKIFLGIIIILYYAKYPKYNISEFWTAGGGPLNTHPRTAFRFASELGPPEKRGIPACD